MGRTTFFLLEQEQKIKEEAQKANKVGILDNNVKEVQKAIANIDDLKRLENLLELETKGNDRKTVVEPLEAKIKKLNTEDNEDQEEKEPEGDK